MLKLAYISKKILVALEPLDIGLARFVKYSLADLNILIISMLNNQPKALNWAFFIFIKFTKWIFRDKGEIMREIKFKFLMENGEVTKPYYLRELIDSDSYINIECEYGSKIKQELQYTGLKDKNDTEIYNNYVLQDDEVRLFQVIEDNRIGQTGYIISCIKNKSEEDHIKIGSIYDFWSWLYPDNYLEVIGNIYENPELLEQSCKQ